MTWLAVFIGGGLGSLLRYALSVFIRQLELSTFPLATLSANILSCLLLGWLVFKLPFSSNPTVVAFLVIGFCGGFSTFSTFSLETLQLMRSGQMAWAVANVLVSISSCLTILFFWSKSLIQ